MECKEFHHWLLTRDIRNNPDSPKAMAHRLGCIHCRKLYVLDTKAEQEIALVFANREMPQSLADRIDLCLDFEADLKADPSISRGFIPILGRLKSLISFKYTGWLVALIMIMAGVFTLRPPSFKNLGQISEQAVMDHLKGNQRISFDTAHFYQALEMFKKELGFNVLLPNLDDQGYSFVGGRLCTLGKCRAAYFVVEKQGKTGSLFIMDIDNLGFKIADKSRFSTTIKGCASQVWKDNGQVYAMVF